MLHLLLLVIMSAGSGAPASPAQPASLELPPKPACTSANRGEVWPGVEYRGNPCVTVEVCSARAFRYRWQPVTVHVSRLSKDAKRRPNCEAAAPSESGSTPAEPRN